MAQINRRKTPGRPAYALRTLLFGLGCAAAMNGSASAAIIGSSTPMDFSGGSISFGYNGKSDFTFSDVSGGIFFNPNAVGVSTSGGGAVTVLGAPFYNQLTPTVYQDPKYGYSAQQFGPDAFVRFSSFSTTTAIPNSLTTFIIGLRDEAADGMHYGYGEFYGTQLVSYAFQTQAGVAIDAGAAISPVPLPGSAPMFGAALVLVGLAGYRAKRRSVDISA